MKGLFPIAIAAALAVTAVSTAHADTSDNWVLRFGGGVVVPQGHTGNLAGMPSRITSSTSPTLDLEYLITPNWGVDLLAAWPFWHEVKLNGNVKVAASRQLPPTATLNYHFLPDSEWSPFVGLGVNYTRFFHTQGSGPLSGDKVRIDSSWGLAPRIGLDAKLSNKWVATIDVRWINIESDVKVNGTRIGTAKVNPFVYGMSVGYRF